MLQGKCGVTGDNLVTDNLQDPLCGGRLVVGYMECLPGEAHIWLDCLVLLPPFSEAIKHQAALHSPEQAVVFTAAFVWPLLRSDTKAGTDTAGITAGNQSEPQDHSWSSVVFPWEKCSKAKVKALQARHATQGRSPKHHRNLTYLLALGQSQEHFPVKTARSVSRTLGVPSKLVQQCFHCHNGPLRWSPSFVLLPDTSLL